MSTPTGSIRDLDKLMENMEVKDRLDDRETLSDSKLKLLLKMQIRITETSLGDKKSMVPQKKSHSAVPNEKYQQKINEFSKKMKSRKPSPHGSNTQPYGKRHTLQDLPDVLQTTPQQVRLKTVRSDIKLTPKPSMVHPGEAGSLEKGVIKKNAMAKRS